MRVPFIAGNWKMHGSRAFVAQFLPALLTGESPSAEVAVFPPFVYLAQAHALLADSKIKLGAQNMEAHDEGAYTGEISGKMLKEFGCEYVLIGHSERRQRYGEADAFCLQKVLSAQANALVPLLCVGESLLEREQGKTFRVIEQQLKIIFASSQVKANAIVLAYEPIWAIGTGKAATPEMAQEVHAFMREKLASWIGHDLAQQVRIVYGGSVKPDNAKALFAQPDIDGALVGGASLLAESFIEIIRAA